MSSQSHRPVGFGEGTKSQESAIVQNHFKWVATILSQSVQAFVETADEMLDSAPVSRQALKLATFVEDWREGFQGLLNEVKGEGNEVGTFTKALFDSYGMRVPEANLSSAEQTQATQPTAEGEPKKMRVCVKTLTGRTITCLVTPENTVVDLKAQIEKREGIPIDQQRFIFMGKQLEDRRSLGGDYLVKDQDVIHLVLRLRGD